MQGRLHAPCREGFMRSIARTGVQAPLGVELGVTGELGIANGKDLDPDELGDGEGQGEAGVGGAVQLNLASVNPAGEEGERVGVRQRRGREGMCVYVTIDVRKTGVASVFSPGHAGAQLSGQAAEGGEHRPATVLQLALAEPLDAENLRVGGELARLHDLLACLVDLLDASLQVLVEVLVLAVDACDKNEHGARSVTPGQEG